MLLQVVAAQPGGKTGASVEEPPAGGDGGTCYGVNEKDPWVKWAREDLIPIKNNTQFKALYIAVPFTPNKTRVKEIDSQLKIAVAGGAVDLDMLLKIVFEYIPGNEPSPTGSTIAPYETGTVMVPTKQAYVYAAVLVGFGPTAKWVSLGSNFAKHKFCVVLTYDW
jgi:hypothetical protein